MTTTTNGHRLYAQRPINSHDDDDPDNHDDGKEKSRQTSRRPSRQPSCRPSRQPSCRPSNQPSCRPSPQPSCRSGSRRPEGDQLRQKSPCKFPSDQASWPHCPWTESQRCRHGLTRSAPSVAHLV
ncbi:unnamed protein product [Polarella glacialis]|uniref:Uncharacterized protein n=1 Tax=Polarella glacialis TaxID=89957 RepID=A0A813E1X9_POLGL|nr:unnamed protein product [Polarella glacialis]CAE8627476.1 unnamed protein product [Polarella glacialis]